jgi:U4/U6 small nuclear ribonucleoprotein PRP4
VKAGNINIGTTGRETLELSERSQAAQEKHAKLLQRVEAERRARSIVVPTAIVDVKAKLRSLGQPITLFGEKPGDRRERLRVIMAKIEVEGEEAAMVDGLLGTGVTASMSAPSAVKKAEKVELFYTPSSSELQESRRTFSKYSWPRARDRLAGAKRRRDSEQLQEEADVKCLRIYTRASKFGMNASQVADDRPSQCCRFSPNAESTMIATCSWSGTVKLWDSETCDQKASYRGHTERVTHLDWHPQACGSQSTTAANLVTASADATAKLWALEAEEGEIARGEIEPTATRKAMLTLKGHKDRVSGASFHPMGKHVGTSSYDSTWRLWDLETGGTELQLQEGHAREIYCIAFQCDGSIVATSDLGAVGRVWDIRNGKSVFLLQGHGRQMLGLDWSPNGYQLASASDDHTVRIWDMRKQKAVYTIPAHCALISSVKFSSSGEMLATASHDGTAKLWSARDYSVIRTLEGHEGKVMSVDIKTDESQLVTCGHDRTFKIWAHEDEF